MYFYFPHLFGGDAAMPPRYVANSPSSVYAGVAQRVGTSGSSKSGSNIRGMGDLPKPATGG